MSEPPVTHEEMRTKPLTKEDEFFMRREEELKHKLEMELAAKEEAEKKAHLKKLHWMHCPKCGNELVEEQTGEIAIDRCNECGGVWVDAGELDILADQVYRKNNPSFINKLFVRRRPQ